MALAPAAMVSRRCTQMAKGIFMQKINAGGLVLLNEVQNWSSGARGMAPGEKSAGKLVWKRVKNVY